jgi:hypothetical protein
MVYDIRKKWDADVAAEGSPDDFETSRKVHKRHNDCKRAEIAKDLLTLSTRTLAGP